VIVVGFIEIYDFNTLDASQGLAILSLCVRIALATPNALVLKENFLSKPNTIKTKTCVKPCHIFQEYSK
jgi:hypothetical protein